MTRTHLTKRLATISFLLRTLNKRDLVPCPRYTCVHSSGLKPRHAVTLSRTLALKDRERFCFLFWLALVCRYQDDCWKIIHARINSHGYHYFLSARWWILFLKGGDCSEYICVCLSFRPMVFGLACKTHTRGFFTAISEHTI